ncbi:MAG: hypothetical protein Q7R56_00060 [Nanoarchaeota archaeon]|nr:hypothetical protein [Nanoarchaeota archaeon]
MAKKREPTRIIIQRDTPMNPQRKFLWILVLLLVVIAVIGTSVDYTGNATKERTTINYEELQHKLIGNVGKVNLETGRFTQTGKTFAISKRQQYDTATATGKQNLGLIINQLETAQRTFQITIRAGTTAEQQFLVKPY